MRPDKMEASKKEKRRKRKKRIIIEMCIDLALLLAFISFHYIQLKREEPLRTPLGQLVEVDGNKMSVYTEGTGDKTLLFLSGSETPSPILDFRSLYSLLSDDYKIVVVERFGYGFSDVVDRPRDIDTILSDTRAALAAADIEGPYVLCPHSLSGLESLYWAQKYPNEVEAIVGLDMAVPEVFENIGDTTFLTALGQFDAKIGLFRIVTLIRDLDCVKYGTLTEEEKDIAHAMFYYKSYNKTIVNEFNYFKKNGETVGAGETPQVPMLLFVSNDKRKREWPGYVQKFASDVENATIIKLDCPHYVHDYEYDRISEEIKAFFSIY